MGANTTEQSRLSVLLDTNILIALEGDEDARHVNGEKASNVFRLIHEAGGSAQILENQFDDFARIRDEELKSRRIRQRQKYVVRSRVVVDSDFMKRAGYRPDMDSRSNDAVDAALLLALARNTASWLITEDRGLHSHSRNLQLHERVMTLDDALSALSALVGAPTPAHFSAEIVEPHVFDLSHAFFDSLRRGYEGFDSWWTEKVVPDGRPCLLIGTHSDIRGLAVLDGQENENLPGPGMKICMFKIAETEQGRKLGESLLEATMSFIRRRKAVSCFIEVSRKRADVLGLLKEFGFFDLGIKDGSPEEAVLGKMLDPAADQNPPTDPLEFNRRYGPGRRIVERAFVVPIIPKYHGMLFPASERQPTLFDTTYGNAVRKVYISHANMKVLEPGDTLLFLRTHDQQAIHAVGIVEQVIRTRDLHTLLSFAGTRTVYAARELEELCHKEVLAIKFRLDEVLERPASRRELIALGVIADSPQSISQVKKEEGIRWVRTLQDA
ncbi:hypothetical protein [uncultured Arthrobacter sp.]|uniref:hypothetical protein n=1 Tax=uncultured Arthrobacter sp. TaxID=114050 RepID=UPI00261868E8|nr:hypothetical protein [uncultured Arthrobacter sp.]